MTSDYYQLHKSTALKTMQAVYKTLLRVTIPPKTITKHPYPHFANSVFCDGKSIYCTDSYLMVRIRDLSMPDPNVDDPIPSLVKLDVSTGAFTFDPCNTATPYMVSNAFDKYEKNIGSEPTKRQTFDSTELKRAFDLFAKMGINPAIRECDNFLYMYGNLGHVACHMILAARA